MIIEWEENFVGTALKFFRTTNNIAVNTYHHVGIYSYTKESLINFTELPKSKNEISLNLEQYRAMDAGIKIGVIFEKDIPPGIDTKDDLITAETIIKVNNDKN